MSRYDALTASSAVLAQAATLLEYVKMATSELTVDEAHRIAGEVRAARAYLDSVRVVLTPGEVL